jgi:hypothetical protein
MAFETAGRAGASGTKNMTDMPPLGLLRKCSSSWARIHEMRSTWTATVVLRMVVFGTSATKSATNLFCKSLISQIQF